MVGRDKEGALRGYIKGGGGGGGLVARLKGLNGST